MRRLLQADFPRIWDEGDERHDLDRALVLLRHALPDWSYAELARLPIGRRDGLLLELRAATFGSRITFVVVCPRCGERLEDHADTNELLLANPRLPHPERLTTAVGEWQLEFRLADTHDLAAVMALPDHLAARELARRSFLSASKAGRELGFDELDDEALAALAQGVVDNDPVAELEFPMQCPGCGHQWIVLFDIAVFLWQEVVSRAKLILRDVHDLALRYGWNEAEVLALAPTRRAYYLEQLGE